MKRNPMLTSDAIAHFGTQAAVARALGYHRQAVNLWGAEVPELSAIKLHRKTKGKLKYDPDFYEEDSKAKSRRSEQSAQNAGLDEQNPEPAKDVTGGKAA